MPAVMNELLIFDSTETLVTTLSNGKPGTCPFYNPVHKYQLANAETALQSQMENSFTFVIPANHSDSQYVVEGNYVVFKDLDNDYQMFEIRIRDDYHDSKLYKHIYAVNIGPSELNDEWIDNITITGSNGSALNTLLTGSRWQAGTVESIGSDQTQSISRMYRLQGAVQLLTLYGGDMKFRITVGAGKITNRYIDWVNHLGQLVVNKIFRAGKDIQSIQRTVNASNLKTALYGYGAKDGNGNPITFTDVVWSVTNGDPVDKPAGQTWVGDPNALIKWGKPDGHGGKLHRFGPYNNSNITDPTVLLQNTWNAVQVDKVPLVSYKTQATNIERVPGYEHEAIRVGDEVGLVVNDFSPPLRIQARIMEIDRDLIDESNTTVVLGNFLPTTVSNGQKLYQLQQTMSNVQGVAGGKLSPGDPIKTDWLTGIIKVLQNEIQSDNGFVYITDSDGILVLDKPQDQSPTKAIRLKGGELAIANSKDSNSGEFIFTTFGTGDGFDASLINVGKLMASVVQIGVDSTYDQGYDPSTKETPTGAQDKANTAETNANNYTNNQLTSYVQAVTYNQDISGLQSQIDGNITSWFYAHDPTLSNAPASTWTENAAKDNHLGDLFYNTSSGYGWRFSKTGSTYSWTQIKDTDIQKALQEASTAQDTADSKRRVFVNQPTPPYDIGDLWDNGGSVWRSNVAKVSGTSYLASDWTKIGDVTSTHTAKDTAHVNGNPASSMETTSGAQTKANTAESNAKIAVSGGQVNLPTSALTGAVDVATNKIQKDSKFYWDSSGFFAIDPNNANNIVRITSGGIGISTDGGTTFKTAMTGVGIVADYITSGEMDVSRINMTIGGSNLITNSDFHNGLTGWSLWNTADCTMSKVDPSGGEQAGVKVSINSTTTIGIGPQTTTFSLKANTTYTVSFKFQSKYNVSKLNYLYLRSVSSGTIKALPNLDVSQAGSDGHVHRYSFQVSHTADVTDAFFLIGTVGTGVTSQGFILREIQVEEGNIATAWGLATGDVPNNTYFTADGIYTGSMTTDDGKGNEVILATGAIKSQQSGVNVMSVDHNGLTMWKDNTTQAGTLRYAQKADDPTKKGIDLMGELDYLSIGFRDGTTQTSYPILDSSNTEEPNVTSLFGNNSTGTAHGRLYLKATGPANDGGSNGNNPYHLVNFFNDIGGKSWLNHEFCAGLDVDTPNYLVNSGSYHPTAAGYAFYQYKGTKDDSKSTLFYMGNNSDGTTVADFPDIKELYLPSEVYLRQSASLTCLSVGSLIGGNMLSVGTHNRNLVMYLEYVEMSPPSAGGYSYYTYNFSGAENIFMVLTQPTGSSSIFYHTTAYNVTHTGFDIYIRATQSSYPPPSGKIRVYFIIYYESTP